MMSRPLRKSRQTPSSERVRVGDHPRANSSHLHVFLMLGHPRSIDPILFYVSGSIDAALSDLCAESHMTHV